MLKLKRRPTPRADRGAQGDAASSAARASCPSGSAHELSTCERKASADRKPGGAGSSQRVNPIRCRAWPSLVSYFLTPQKKPRQGAGLSFAAEEACRVPSSPHRETTHRKGPGIGGKPLTKRRAAKLVSVSSIRRRAQKKPRRSGAKLVSQRSLPPDVRSPANEGQSRRQAPASAASHDETSSREVGFCVEYPTRQRGTRCRTQPHYWRSARAWR